jgi:hypothetical protein
MGKDVLGMICYFGEREKIFKGQSARCYLFLNTLITIKPKKIGPPAKRNKFRLKATRIPACGIIEKKVVNRNRSKQNMKKSLGENNLKGIGLLSETALSTGLSLIRSPMRA